jgi:4-amino-4-deoxy-L-arabinose transferase-like glycosyltransferase
MIILGAALALACLAWGRRALIEGLKSVRRERWIRVDIALCLLLLGGSFAFRTWDMDVVGQTWDEDVYWTAGRNYVQNLLSADIRAESWSWNHEHPALAKWLYGPATLIDEDFHAARLVAVFIGALTCVVVFLLGRDLISRRVGFLGAALAAVTPHIVGHHKIIGLETPTGLFYLLTVWLFFKGLRRGGNTRWYLLAAVSAGLALATRLSNLSLLLLMLLLYVVAHRAQIKEQRAFPVSITLGLVPLCVLLLFLGLWPYLWDNPLGHLGKTLSHWKPDIFLEHFLGKRQEPPIYYFPLYFVVTTPVVALPMVVLGVVRTAFKRDLGHLALLLTFVTPWVVIFSPMARDGVRYLYPALFAACLLAAAGADWLAAGIGRLLKRRALAAPVLGLLGAAIGLQSLHAGLTVHPYYIDYYNELTGGPRGAAKGRLFEIAWWGEGLKEAADYIARVAPHRATINIHAHPTHVVRLRPDLQLVDHMEADFVIFNNLFNNPVQLPRHVIGYVVRAAGAPLVWVYQRAELTDAAPEEPSSAQ